MNATPRPWTYTLPTDRRKPSLIQDANGRTLFSFHDSGAAYRGDLLHFTVEAVNAYDDLKTENARLREAIGKLLMHRNQHDLHPIDYQRLEAALRGESRGTD